LLYIEDNEVAEGVAVIAEVPGNDLDNDSIVRVVNNNNQSVVSFFFRKNQVFPYQVVAQSEEGRVTGNFSLYDLIDERYAIQFEKAGEAEYAVAVFDADMTNKRVTVFDERLNLLDKAHRNFAPEKAWRGDGSLGFTRSRKSKRSFWTSYAGLRHSIRSRRLPLRRTGRRLFVLTRRTRCALPAWLYTHEPGEAFQRAFYAKVGDRDALQKTTFTLPLSAMINAAKEIFFCKRTCRRRLPGCILSSPILPTGVTS
jgi:hypothetical protein